MHFTDGELRMVRWLREHQMRVETIRPKHALERSVTSREMPYWRLPRHAIVEPFAFTSLAHRERSRGV